MSSTNLAQLNSPVKDLAPGSMTRAVCGGGLVRLAVLSLRPPERMLVMPAIFYTSDNSLVDVSIMLDLINFFD